MGSMCWFIMNLMLVNSLIFGTVITQASKIRNPEASAIYLFESARDFILDAVMSYTCSGHRLWFFMSEIMVPALTNILKNFIN